MDTYRDGRNYLERLVLSAIFSNLYCDMYVELLTPIHYLNYYLCLFRYCLRLDLLLLLGLVSDVSGAVMEKREKET